MLHYAVSLKKGTQPSLSHGRQKANTKKYAKPHIMHQEENYKTYYI